MIKDIKLILLDHIAEVPGDLDVVDIYSKESSEF